jgi:hypothetical protein
MSRRLVLRVVAVAAAAAAFVACGPVFPLDPELEAGVITLEGEGDRYAIETADGVTTATAARTNTSGNDRFVFWRKVDADTADQETCATWVDNTTHTQQQGAALRVQAFGEDHVRAITFTKNMIFGYYWVFNVHVMDTSGEKPYTMIGRFDLGGVFYQPDQPGDVEPYPWRMCARAIDDVVSFKVWPLTHPEPAWNDPAYGGSVTLPAGWDYAARPGWYIGHLRPGEQVGFTDMTTAEVTDVGAATTTGAEVVEAEPTTPPRHPTDVPVAP